jgi:hypothetical protein
MARRNKSRGLAAVLTTRAVLEVLEERQLLSTYYVSAAGSDSAAGSSSTPWATLQYAANQVQAGDVVDVAAGNYSGFQLSTSGGASDPITFNFASGAVINGTPGTTNGEIDLSGCNYVTINGADIQGSNGARAGIWAGGYAGDNVNGILIENSTCNDCTDWGFLSGFMNNSTLLDDTFSNTQVQHGAYIGNSSNDDTVQGCTFFGNSACGFECNEDLTSGGPGYGGGLVIDGNTFYDNASSAGASINFDGVQNSLIENNVIYNGQRNGIALYQINGALPSTGNTIVNNTIDVNSASDSGYAAIALLDGAADTTIYNNILSAAEDSISADSASQVGLVCDYNIFGTAGIDPTGESYGNNVSLSAWQAMGYDTHSLDVGNALGSLFVNVSSGNFQLASGSAAIGAGTATDAPTTDQLGNARPTDGRYDIGAIQYQGSSVSTPPAPVIDAPTVTIAGATSATTGDNVTYTVSSTDTTADELSGFTLNFGDGSSPEKIAATETLSDGVYTASATFTHDFLNAGTYTVTASAADSLGITPAQNSVTVVATAPTAPTAPTPPVLATPLVTLAGPTSAIVGTPVTYTATVTNPTGNDGLTGGYFTIGARTFNVTGTETEVDGVWTAILSETYAFHYASFGGDLVTFTAADSFGEVAGSDGIDTIVAAYTPTVSLSGPFSLVAGTPGTWTAESNDLSVTSFTFSINSTTFVEPATLETINGVSEMVGTLTYTLHYASYGGDTISVVGNTAASNINATNTLLAIVTAI